jgi:hypothetical protein
MILYQKINDISKVCYKVSRYVTLLKKITNARTQVWPQAIIFFTDVISPLKITYVNLCDGIEIQNWTFESINSKIGSWWTLMARQDIIFNFLNF